MLEMRFNEMVATKLMAYVYALLDPRPSAILRDRIFYIGKGTGNRCFNHARLEYHKSEASLEESEHKLSRIRDIREAGYDVEVLIIAHGLSDQTAHDFEAVLIPILGETNKMSGHRDQDLWLTISEINEAYDHPVMRCDVPLFRGNILFVSLNRQNTKELVESKGGCRIEEATLGEWNLSAERSAIVDCVVGVKASLIVSIFEIKKNLNGSAEFLRISSDKKRAHGRSRFIGNRRHDLERDLCGRSVTDGLATLTKLRPGAGCQFYQAMPINLRSD